MKIIILGYPKSGKTKFSSKFSDVIHSDDFIKDYDFKSQIYVLMSQIQGKDYVVEGIQGFRLFRKMLELNKDIPDEVYYIKPKYPALPEHERTRKMLDTVWRDCLILNKNNQIKVTYIEGE